MKINNPKTSTVIVELPKENNNNQENIENSTKKTIISKKQSHKNENDDNFGENKINQNEKSTKKSKKNFIPQSYIDLVSMSKRVLEVWKTKPELNLLWMTPSKFELILQEIEKAITDKSNNKTKRSPIVSQLTELDKEIDKNISYLKNHITIKFGKQHRKAYYADFGIEIIGKNYCIPKDRQQRVKSLEKIVNSLQHYQMIDKDYCFEYWNNIKNKYIELVNNNLDLTQDVSLEAGKKSYLRKQIREILIAVKSLIKIQYPQQWQYVLREFGYLRDHF